MPRHAFAAGLVMLFASAATGQEIKFFYPAPPAAAVETLKDQPYGALQMDVYRPPNAAGQSLPALIFSNLATGAQRSNAFYKAWAEIAASKGLVAILPDLREESFPQDFAALLAHLAANASGLGIDRERIAVYAGSGNAYRTLPLVQDAKLTAIKAAVMYYGGGQVATFRRDLPVLLVRAGLDRPGGQSNHYRTGDAGTDAERACDVAELPRRPPRIRDRRRRGCDARSDRHHARVRQARDVAGLPGVDPAWPARGDCCGGSSERRLRDRRRKLRRTRQSEA